MLFWASRQCGANLSPIMPFCVSVSTVRIFSKLFSMSGHLDRQKWHDIWYDTYLYIWYLWYLCLLCLVCMCVMVYMCGILVCIYSMHINMVCNYVCIAWYGMYVWYIFAESVYGIYGMTCMVCMVYLKICM